MISELPRCKKCEEKVEIMIESMGNIHMKCKVCNTKYRYAAVRKNLFTLEIKLIKEIIEEVVINE